MNMFNHPFIIRAMIFPCDHGVCVVNEGLVGGVLQVMTLVDCGLLPLQAPLPVTVRVAVKLPEATEGVNVALETPDP